MRKIFKISVTALMLCFFSTTLLAQDAGINVKITNSETTWYTQPWIWIVGGAVFILLLVALLRGGGRKI